MKKTILLISLAFVFASPASFRNDVSAQNTKSEETLTPTFWSDWESGLVTGADNHNWRYSQQISSYSFAVINDPAFARQGNNYALVEVRAGDDPRNAHDGTERSEVLRMQNADGTELFENLSSGTVQYSFSVKLDNSWQNMVPANNGNVWCSVLQLHGPDALNTSPDFAISAKDQFWFLPVFGMTGTNAGIEPNIKVSLGLLNKGNWIDFIMTIKYANDYTGFVTIQRRDEGQTDYTQVYNLTNTPTLQWGTGGPGTVGDHYLKSGIYRNSQTFISILYLDGFTRYVDSSETGLNSLLIPSFSVFPNPANDKLSAINPIGLKRIEICDLTAKMVFLKKKSGQFNQSGKPTMAYTF